MSAKKRTKRQREYDLYEIAELYLKGKPQQAIADHLAQNRDYTVTQQTISRDIATIQQRWLDSSLTDYNAAKAQELARIDNLERVYWEQFEASKAQTIRRKVSKRDGSVIEVSQDVSNNTGDPRFLQGVMSCIEKRIKILGLDAPTKMDTTTQNLNVDLNELSTDQLKRIAAGEDLASVLSSE